MKSHFIERRQHECRTAEGGSLSLARESFSDGAGGTARRRRHGSLMVEMVVAAVMLSTIAAILVPGVYAVHQQRQATRFETLALIELNNLSAVALSNVAADGAALKLSEWFTKRYVDTTLEVEEVATAGVSLRALRFTIVRPAADGHPDFRHSLVAWVAASEVQE